MMKVVRWWYECTVGCSKKASYLQKYQAEKFYDQTSSGCISVPNYLRHNNIEHLFIHFWYYISLYTKKLFLTIQYFSMNTYITTSLTIHVHCIKVAFPVSAEIIQVRIPLKFFFFIFFHLLLSFDFIHLPTVFLFIFIISSSSTNTHKTHTSSHKYI